MVPLQGGSLSYIEMLTTVWVLDDDAGRYARAVEIADEYAGEEAGAGGDGGRRRLALPVVRRDG